MKEERELHEQIKWLEDNLYDLRCVDSGEDSYVWEVGSHWMTPPTYRVEGIGETILKAIKNARENEEINRPAREAIIFFDEVKK